MNPKKTKNDIHFLNCPHLNNVRLSVLFIHVIIVWFVFIAICCIKCYLLCIGFIGFIILKIIHCAILNLFDKCLLQNCVLVICNSIIMPFCSFLMSCLYIYIYMHQHVDTGVLNPVKPPNG